MVGDLHGHHPKRNCLTGHCPKVQGAICTKGRCAASREGVYYRRTTRNQRLCAAGPAVVRGIKRFRWRALGCIGCGLRLSGSTFWWPFGATRKSTRQRRGPWRGPSQHPPPDSNRWPTPSRRRLVSARPCSFDSPHGSKLLAVCRSFPLCPGYRAGPAEPGVHPTKPPFDLSIFRTVHGVAQTLPPHHNLVQLSERSDLWSRKRLLPIRVPLRVWPADRIQGWDQQLTRSPPIHYTIPCQVNSDRIVSDR